MLFFGRVLAYTGMLENKEVTWFPSYGAEIRGGTANCTVIISDELIGSPIVTNPDILIVMNEASLKKFQAKLRQKGLLIFDSSLIKDPELRKDIEIVRVPATEISNAIGNAKSANMVLLGAFIGKTKLLEKEHTFDALEDIVPERRMKSIGVNKKAIIEGMKFIEDKKG
ncbi:MAG: 2-oxoacid:acceptor oxidoreductase family protein [Nitrospirota bacterium]|nr:2-oxoacid:acceptor oxidoreductase family protein [Nitrospirota bacterium]MDH5767615.1 2-oxoacid:acceptor oxidoreductase family protein [Nitrospirota bacterium]